MKCYFVVTDTNEANCLLSIDKLELQIEKSWYYLEQITPLVKRVRFAKLSATTFGVWLDIPVEIQGVRYVNVAVATITLSIDILSNADRTMYRNFNSVTVNEFMAGKNYLVPFTAGAVTDMVPDTEVYPIEGTTDAVFIGQNYLFMAGTKEQVRNGVSFTGIIFDLDIEATAVNARRTSQKESIRTAQFVNASVSLGGARR